MYMYGYLRAAFNKKKFQKLQFVVNPSIPLEFPHHSQGTDSVFVLRPELG